MLVVDTIIVLKRFLRKSRIECDSSTICRQYSNLFRTLLLYFQLVYLQSTSNKDISLMQYPPTYSYFTLLSQAQDSMGFKHHMSIFLIALKYIAEYFRPR